MNKIHQSIAVLVLELVGLMGCGFEPRVVGDTNPARVEEMKQTLRDLWVGHIFWVRHVVSNIATNDPEERDAAEKEVVTNTKQIAHTMTPFTVKPRRRNSIACWMATLAQYENTRRPRLRRINSSRMLHLLTWRPMPTRSPISLAISILTCRKTPFGAWSRHMERTMSSKSTSIRQRIMRP